MMAKDMTGSTVATTRSPDQPRAKLTSDVRNEGPGATMNRFAIRNTAPQMRSQQQRRSYRG
jgi:hypothetical protein